MRRAITALEFAVGGSFLAALAAYVTLGLSALAALA